ncbi:hypothetical protein D3C87_1929830 [compost metagenome]
MWRVKNPNPKFNDRLKWNLITILLTLIRGTNIITSSNNRKEALTETLGRLAGFFSLLFNKPRLEI